MDSRFDIDPVVICPYNKSHRIARSRIQGHLVKCEKVNNNCISEKLQYFTIVDSKKELTLRLTYSYRNFHRITCNSALTTLLTEFSNTICKNTSTSVQ